METTAHMQVVRTAPGSTFRSLTLTTCMSTTLAKAKSPQVYCKHGSNYYLTLLLPIELVVHSSRVHSSVFTQDDQARGPATLLINESCQQAISTLLSTRRYSVV